MSKHRMFTVVGGVLLSGAFLVGGPASSALAGPLDGVQHRLADGPLRPLVNHAPDREGLVHDVRTRLFHNVPAIAAAEFEYVEMWAQDVGAMVGYHGGAHAHHP